MNLRAYPAKDRMGGTQRFGWSSPENRGLPWKTWSPNTLKDCAHEFEQLTLLLRPRTGCWATMLASMGLNGFIAAKASIGPVEAVGF